MSDDTTRPQRLSDLTKEQRQEIARRLAPAEAEADALFAPLMALQWAEMDADPKTIPDDGDPDLHPTS